MKLSELSTLNSPTGNEKIPCSDTTNQSLPTAITLNQIKEFGDNIFWVTYDTTTYAEITQALADGKLPILKTLTNYYAIYWQTADNKHRFCIPGVSPNIVNIRYSVNTSNVWEQATAELVESSKLIDGSVTKLGKTNIGDANTPIYLEAGVPKACTSSFTNELYIGAEAPTDSNIKLWIDTSEDS